MKQGLFIFLFFFCSQIFGQIDHEYIDSLKVILKLTKNDSTKARVYRLLENSTRPINSEVSIKYLDSGLVILKKLNWERGFAIYYNDMGANYLDRNIYDKALEYFHKSLDYSGDIPLAKISTYTNLSNLYLIQNNDALSKFYNEKVYHIAIKEHYDDGLGDYYSQAALLEKDTLKKQRLLKKAIEIRKQLDNPLELATSYTNLGDISKNINDRLENYFYSKTIFDKVNPNYPTATSNDMAIGETYLFLALNEKVRRDAKITESKEILLNKAEELITKAIEISKEYNYPQNIFYGYGKLSEVKKAKGDFKAALEFVQMNYKMYDSIFSQENKNKIASLENQREMQMRDKEIELNKLKLDSQKKQQTYLLGGLVLLAAIGGLLFHQNRTRRKNNQKLLLLNKELDESNKIKTRFFSILNHDLRSPVSNLIHFLHLQKDNPELLDEATKTRMQSKTISGAENLLSSMEDILLWSKGQMENFKPELKSVLVEDLFVDNRKVFSGYLNIHFEYHNPENLQLFTDENYLKTIMRNLTSNAINVLANTEKPTIVWKTGQENGIKRLSIADNGRGADESQFMALYNETEVVGIKSGLGLHLIRDLAKAIDCDIKVDSQIGRGTTFTLFFK